MTIFLMLRFFKTDIFLQVLVQAVNKREVDYKQSKYIRQY